MTAEDLRVREEFNLALDLAKRHRDGVGLVGHGIMELRDRHGDLKDFEIVRNKITTVGDSYYATRGAAGIGTPNIAQPTLLNGMKLGTGTTAATKSGAASALITYITGSNKLFDTTHPAVAAIGTDVGYSITYKNTWPAGTVTNSAITEAVLVTDAATDATSDAAHTIARIVFTAKNKTVDDSLTITWVHTFFG